ncbi:DUF4349 domain-containing protein [Microbacterium paludicola]|uniref:DUF4349 domain-containing protein n=1 Tax=Microbacterium paludicola TaxID=300019 RepID=UPI003879694E
MNTHRTTDHSGLPEVSDETLARMEARVFEAIDEERVTHSSRSRRRRRAWQGVGIAAAFVVVGAVATPVVLQLGQAGSGGVSSADSAEVAPAAPEEQSAADGGGAEAVGPLSASTRDTVAQAADREIIRTGSASIVVDDAAAAAEAITQLTSEHDGWVEQLSIGADRSYTGETGDSTVWVPDDGGYISVRVPADELDPLMDSLDEIGEVASSRVQTQDVTSQAVDLRARIDAARASVDRLTELLAQSGSVGDLVEVETTLSERQAELESLESQLESLEGQVAMSTLSVSLLAEAPPVEPDPAGFGDGLETGWNGLLAVINGLVVALGFALPWLGVIAVAWLVVWLVLRLIRRRRESHTAG